MIARSTALLLVSLLVSGGALAQSSSNTFELHLNGKPVGKDVFTLSKTKNGYKLVSLMNYSVKNHDGDFRDEFSYSDTYAYLDGSTTDKSINQQTSYLPSKGGKDLTIAYMAAGKTSSKIIDLKPNLIVMPSMDAGAAQAFLLEAITHPTPDNHFSIFIPDNGAVGQLANPEGAPPRPDQTLPPVQQLYDCVFAKGGPLTGTVDGKAITVNTFALLFGKIRWIFFADEENNLMQVNSTLVHGSYIRAGFKLDPPKKAIPQ